MKFVLFLLLFVLLIITTMEIISRFYVGKRIQEVIEKKNEFRYWNDQKVIEFKNKYVDRLDHLRGPSAVRFDETPPSNLLFTVVRPFSGASNQNILIHGDSWADAAKHSQNFIKAFGKKNNFGIILGGVRSYSPSPMTIQLDILRDDFGIYPSVIIGIIDQTDIGDELFRYKVQFNDNFGHLKSLAQEGTNKELEFQALVREKNFTSKKFAIVKLLIHLKFYIKDKIFKRGAAIIPGLTILSPLTNGVDVPSGQYFSFRLNRYIETVFNDSNIKKLILVTHPHRKHLVDDRVEKKFKGEVGTLVNQVVVESKHKNKILHIDFFASEKIKFLTKNFKNIFIENDPFSHLTRKMYSEYYYPFIFSKLRDLEN